MLGFFICAAILWFVTQVLTVRKGYKNVGHQTGYEQKKSDDAMNQLVGLGVVVIALAYIFRDVHR